MNSHSSYPPFTDVATDRIAVLGEVALLAKIRAWLGDASPQSPQGIGDDCAVWPHPPQGEQLLFTTDAVVYGHHFDDTCPPQLAAAKLLKRNLSDIAAMGGTPHSALLALTLPRNLSLQWLEQFYLGLRECSLRYATPITGGDITEGTDNFFAAHVTLIGHAKRPLLRTGAKNGDHLFVTGALGGSIHGHHLHFEPRLPEGRWLAAQPDVRAMIDLTDGLAKDLPELLEAEAASPRVGMCSAHSQAKRQCDPLVGGQGQEQGEAKRQEQGEAQGQAKRQGEAQTKELGRAQTKELGRAQKEAQTKELEQKEAREQGQDDAQQQVIQRTGVDSAKAQNAEPAANATTQHVAVALLDLATLPLTAVVRTLGAAAQIPSPATLQPDAAAQIPSPTTLQPGAAAQILPASPQMLGTPYDPIAHALTDGEDYELLFAVDGKTDPVAFIARWHAHFGRIETPAQPTPTPSTPAQPHSEQSTISGTTSNGQPQAQAAQLCHIGRIGLAANHPAGASRLYNAATGLPIVLAKGGFEHL